MSAALALLIGLIAGCRALAAPAAVSWAAFLGFLSLHGNGYEFLGYRYTPWVFTLLAAVELFADKLSGTPSRTEPLHQITRIVAGGFSGAAIGAGNGMVTGGAILGILGAMAGTYAGAALRAGMARWFGSDRPAAITEDALVLVAAGSVVALL